MNIQHPPIWRIFNYVGLQIGWFACAWGAAQGKPWLGPIVVGLHLIIHLWQSTNRSRELYYILMVGLLGMGIDSLKKATGFITYASDIPLEWLAPFWITAMWLLFSTTFSSSLAWLQGRYGLAAALGAIFGPLSYVAGERLAGITFNYNLPLTVLILAAVWGSVTPALAWLAKWMRNPNINSN